jgi:hypothetical protein
LKHLYNFEGNVPLVSEEINSWGNSDDVRIREVIDIRD